MMYGTLIVHPTRFTQQAQTHPPLPVPLHITQVSVHHARAMKAALRAVMLTSDRERKDVTFALSALLETPRASLVQRLIDLAPQRDRATLREQIL